MSRTVRRRRRLRLFERAECKNCGLKDSRYCWRECPYNIWRRSLVE